MAGLFALGALKPPIKRKTFFSFDYDDVMRVNNVRNAWKITHPDSALNRSFYDSSLWESKKLEGDEALKRLIREGVQNTSAVCVLVGSATWQSRWVRYEIARAVIDKRGLLAVHINGLRHHQRQVVDPPGLNPLSLMAVGKVQLNMLAAPQYYLFQRTANGWERYPGYLQTVELPSYLPDPASGYVTTLSEGTMEYDFVRDGGATNIGQWIDHAAQKVGR